MRRPFRGIPLALVACGTLLAIASRCWAQVSPGPLAAAHRSLDGTLQCFQCHDPKAGMDARCLACHQEVDAMRKARRGYHARVADRACARCHPDHGGRDFKLVAWEGGSAKAFDHRRAGYALEGKHAALECSACHKTSLQRSSVARLIKKKDHAGSWLGLETACASCHEDPHRGQLDTRCQSCHDPSGWKPAAGFDHAHTDYPLTGKHAEVACAKCHEAATLMLAHDRQGRTVPQYKPLPHRDCVSCHRDPHAGRFRGTCASCHGTSSFTAINSRGFDHDVTRYPLRGRHAALACERCHDSRTAWGKKPPFARCDACHPDAHAGQATLAGKPADCVACHTVQGFHPSSFTVEAHAASSYPLAGAHARTDCSSCHTRHPATPAMVAKLGEARVSMRPAAGRCEDCHRDPHRGRFGPGGERAQVQACLACHDFERFRPSRVDAVRHGDFAYRLQGAHRAVSCQSCHAELEKPPARSSLPVGGEQARTLTFAVAAGSCASCHTGPHGDQFAGRKGGGACESCHGVEAFAPARFDHDRDARFRLEGAHERVACAACHPAQRAPGGARRVLYRPLSRTCESCHATTPPAPAPRKS